MFTNAEVYKVDSCKNSTNVEVSKLMLVEEKERLRPLEWLNEEELRQKLVSAKVLC